MSMRDLKVHSEPASRNERWLLVVAAAALLCALAWSWSDRSEVQLAGLIFVWLMVTCASLVVVRIAAYRRRARRRESIAEQVVGALNRKAVSEATTAAPVGAAGAHDQASQAIVGRVEGDRIPPPPG